MRSPSSPDNNDGEPLRRGKTTFHGIKATPKVLRPVQPQHVYDDYENDREARHSREERKPRRRSAPPDFATFGMFAFFGVLALGVIFYLVQGASTMPFDTVGDTQEDVARKNEETRRINEMRAREAASRPQPEPTARETPVIPATSRKLAAPAPSSEPASNPSSAPANVTGVPIRPPAPGPLGGISAGMSPDSAGAKPQNETPKTPPPAAPAATPATAPDAAPAAK